MRLDTPIADIMSSDLITATCDNSLKDVELLMQKYHIRHIPILQDNKLYGIISLTDLQRISFADAYNSDEKDVDYVIYDLLTLDQVMVKNPITVNKSDTVKKAGTTLTEHEFHALPVVDGDELVGIVTSTDLLRYLIS
jgi:CBS domain-containing protein